MKDDNLNVYSLAKVINGYSQLNYIDEAEKTVFAQHSDYLSTSTLLDIGIGAGRTTQYLINKCKSYTGIDYSQGFVASVKKIYPKADIRLMDARDLSVFEDNKFDFVNFSFNGMDYVDLAGRVKILREVNRVLKPKGIFFFSTHNKDHPTFNKLPWLDKRNTPFTNVKTFLKLVPFLLRHFRKKREEIYQTEYAIINDCAHNFSLMTFYTSSDFLRKQLIECKYSETELLLKSGSKAINDKLDEWIFVTCRKLVP